MAAQRADSLGLGIAGGETALHVGMAGGVLLELCDGDAVQGGIQLTVATTIEPYTLGVARPDGYGCGAGVACIGRGRPKATDIGGLTHEFGSRQHATAEQRQQSWRQRSDELADLTFQAV